MSGLLSTSTSVSGSGILHANRTFQTVFLVMTRGVNSAVGALVVGAVRLHMSNLVTFEATYGGSLDGSRRWSRARHRLRREKGHSSRQTYDPSRKISWRVTGERARGVIRRGSTGR